MLAVVSSAALVGIRAMPVQVEVNTCERGELKMILVGLPDAAVKESNDRVFSALANSGFRLPSTRTTINLAPGSLRKEGPRFDLAIALGLLAALGQLRAKHLDRYIIGGELSLSGATRPIKGGLSLTMLAREQGKAGVLLPQQSAEEAALVDQVPVYAVHSLSEACAFLEGRKSLPRQRPLDLAQATVPAADTVDFAEVKGQQQVRRAVEVAVAGGHNILIIGPPGAGKSMMARRIPTIMPEPSLEECLAILSVHSAAGNTLQEHFRTRQRPFRAPHHTISDVGLLGGGPVPGPGEISLAHHGVLFLDELPEFKRSTLEVLRQPLEDGEVCIARSAAKVTFPCSFMLVAAMNPCPCGYLSAKERQCRCSTVQIQRYRTRISGPLLDRIDIHCEAPSLSVNELRSAKPGEASATIRTRVQAARQYQRERYRDSAVFCNARMSHAMIQKYCSLDNTLADILQQAMQRLQLSARAYNRILKVSRTIADLESSPAIQAPHLLEAIQYRSLDRTTFY